MQLPRVVVLKKNTHTEMVTTKKNDDRSEKEDIITTILKPIDIVSYHL